MEKHEASALHGARSHAVKSYEPIMVGGIILVLSIKEVLTFVAAFAALGITLVYRQVGGGSKECGRDPDGNPRYRFRVKMGEEKKK